MRRSHQVDNRCSIVYAAAPAFMHAETRLHMPNLLSITSFLLTRFDRRHSVMDYFLELNFLSYKKCLSSEFVCLLYVCKWLNGHLPLGWQKPQTFKSKNFLVKYAFFLMIVSFIVIKTIPERTICADQLRNKTKRHK